jgi:predicted DNA-binding transcriptional regulator YafY
MAGKNQSQRIKVIDKYLRRGRKLTWEELRSLLIDELFLDDLSERSIKGDIAEMRKGFMGLEPAPIVNKDGKYFYEEDFNLFGSPIKDQEAFVLMNALDILDQFPDFDHSKKVKQIVKKLQNVLDIEEKKSLRVIAFENVTYPAAGQWIKKLYPFVKQRSPIRLSYQSFQAQEPKEEQVVPLLLKEFNGRWNLISYHLTFESINNYPLDRIKGFEPLYFDLSETKIKFDPETYFDDFVGVTPHEKGPVEIHFQCSEYLANYFETKPFHMSQQRISDDDYIYAIYCHLNIELIARFLHYGEDVLVLSPHELVKEISDKIKKMNERYL